MFTHACMVDVPDTVANTGEGHANVTVVMWEYYAFSHKKSLKKIYSQQHPLLALPFLRLDVGT